MPQVKVAFYGNNLNFGYFFVRSLRQAGVDAILLCPRAEHAQERHDWWTDAEQTPEWVRAAPSIMDGGSSGSEHRDGIEELYAYVRQCDLLLLAENGPANFSELVGAPPRVFVSFGYDLQNIPFLAARYLSQQETWQPFRRTMQDTCRGHFGAPLLLGGQMRTWYRALKACRYIQMRQRHGLRQCERLVLSPHQRGLARGLKLDESRILYVPLPMDVAVLSEIDEASCQTLRQRYSNYDTVFFHPTRQFYLQHNNDPYKKDNDKLLYAYGSYLKTAHQRTRLLLVEKGDPRDIAHSKDLITSLGIEAFVEWLPELPNKRLRSFYTLPNLVVCDQFSPNLAVLGNVGREASYFGRPLITAFEAWNKMLYGGDIPAHVFPATSAERVQAAMHKVASMASDERERLTSEAVHWFARHHADKAVIPLWIQLLETVAGKSMNEKVSMQHADSTQTRTLRR